MNDLWQDFRLASSPNSAFIEAWQHLRKDTHVDGRCISQNELAKRWQISEATLERWRSQRKGPHFLRLGGQGPHLFGEHLFETVAQDMNAVVRAVAV